jgi:hypothetical protein
MAFVEVVAAGILRIAALCFQWNWYGSTEKWREQKNSKIQIPSLISVIYSSVLRKAFETGMWIW